MWVQEVEGGPPRAVTPEDVRRPALVGDGRFVCARAADSEWYLYPVDEKGEPRKVDGVLPGEEPISSTPDGLLYIRGADELRAGEGLMTTRVFRLDPLTGRRELWKEIPTRRSEDGRRDLDDPLLGRRQDLRLDPHPLFDGARSGGGAEITRLEAGAGRLGISSEPSSPRRGRNGPMGKTGQSPVRTRPGT